MSKSNWIVVGGVLAMLSLLLFRWTATGQMEKQQAALITAIQDGSWRRCAKLISESYEDRWGWNREDLGKVFKDVRSQFLVLTVSLENTTWDIANRKATVKARVRLQGSPLGMGSGIQSRVNQEATSMVFNWVKESWWPWSWKLVRMNHAELEIPDSYTPGDLLRMRNGQLGF